MSFCFEVFTLYGDFSWDVPHHGDGDQREPRKSTYATHAALQSQQSVLSLSYFN